jgi:predicted amidophosphoribosyltransferase
VAILSTAAAFARDWGGAFLNLAFPYPESDEAEPKPVEPPFCQTCGYPYAHVPDAPFVCSTCADSDWSFAWARAGYLTEGQVHEAVVGFKYGEQFFRRAQLAGWLTEAFDRYAAGEEWDALVPVPLYHRRLRTRRRNWRMRSAGGAACPSGPACGACARRPRRRDSGEGRAGKTCGTPSPSKGGLTLPAVICY